MNWQSSYVSSLARVLRGICVGLFSDDKLIDRYGGEICDDKLIDGARCKKRHVNYFSQNRGMK